MCDLNCDVISYCFKLRYG